MRYTLVFCVLVISLQLLHAQVESELLPNELQFSQQGNSIDSTIYGYDSLSIRKNTKQLTINQDKVELKEDLKFSALTPSTLKLSFDLSTGRQTTYADHYLSFAEIDHVGPPQIGTAWSMTSRNLGLNRPTLIIGEETIGGIVGGVLIPAISMQSIVSSDGIRIGMGTEYPKSKLHIPVGDIYLEGIAEPGSDGGIIMKSPNGNCWKLGVNDAGEPVFTNMSCP